MVIPVDTQEPTRVELEDKIDIPTVTQELVGMVEEESGIPADIQEP